MVKGKKSAPQNVRYRLDCTVLVDDEILDLASFQKFLMDRIKVNGKAGQLGDKIAVDTDKNDDKVLTVSGSKDDLKKRYLKYLTKKYLKKHELRDFFRVIATDKNTYKLKYFKIDGANNGDDDEDDE